MDVQAAGFFTKAAALSGDFEKVSLRVVQIDFRVNLTPPA
jgi:hypothetical protein